MKKILLSLFTLLIVAYVSSAQCLTQCIIYDFETQETTTEFQYFGSSLDGTLASNIANPNPTGVNTSATVVEYVKAANSEVWAGAFANPAPEPMDLTSGGTICVDVHMDHIGNLALKLEASSTGGSNWVTIQENTVTGQWETLCFDLSANGLEDAMTPAAGHVYGQIVFFVDFQSNSDMDVTSYIDNMVYNPPPTQITIFDFETPETTTEFQYFGSTLDGTLAANIANPNATGINTSSTVVEYVKAANSEVWAGAFANPAPGPIDATNGGTICVDVHMDHIGVLAIKLEASSTGGSNWIFTQPNTVADQWETICFDLSENGLEDAMTPAAGHIYNQIVVFPDFGSNAPEDETYYLDNIVLNTTITAEMSDVVFTVNMGEKVDFTTVYLSGEFNDWSGNANPMTEIGNNVWSTTINVENRTYEYKFQLDEWAQSEQFDGSDVCTVTTEDGQFTNRVVLVTGDSDLGPVCYESCYDCGQSVNITWNVNMENETVSELGVYVAGGEFFGHGDLPPMTDPDGDGVYSITLEREIGFTTDYTFINGLCLPDWSCKEDISGQDCAVAPFNDRNLAPAMSDTEINTCFGFCSTDGSCSGVGTEDLDFDADLFQVRPSVTSDYAEILWNGNEDRKIAVYNISGQLMTTYNIASHVNSKTIDVSAFGSGIYVIRMTTESKVGSQKLVIR